MVILSRLTLQTLKNRYPSQALRDGFLRIQTEAVPMTPDQQEGYFAEAANQGEQLIAQGEEHYVEAALHFFRALRVYGNPGELLAGALYLPFHYASCADELIYVSLPTSRPPSRPRHDHPAYRPLY